MRGSSRFFCAVQSRASQEPIYATVARVHRWFLLEYPGAWRRDAVDGSCLPDTFKATLERLHRQEPCTRALLMRQTYRHTGSIRCFFVRSCESPPRILQLDLLDYSQLEDADFSDLEARAQPFDRPLYAVCTHGTHDRCCAKFGFPTFNALRAQTGQLAWQCSHVGGDRFAPNLVCFPQGIYYGCVNPEEIRPVVEKHTRGEISLKHYRGRCCYPKIVQAAEYFVRTETGKMQIDEFRLIEAAPGQGKIARVRFEAVSDGTIHDVEIRRITGAFSEQLTCDATHPSAVTQYDLLRHTIVWPERSG